MGTGGYFFRWTRLGVDNGSLVGFPIAFSPLFLPRYPPCIHLRYESILSVQLFFPRLCQFHLGLCCCDGGGTLSSLMDSAKGGSFDKELLILNWSRKRWSGLFGLWFSRFQSVGKLRHWGTVLQLQVGRATSTENRQMTALP